MQAIVEEYIETAEPVSSGNLVKDLEVSSATIRNEMAELEKIGFLEKPHTSAGRIPSQKGYRYYVDELIRDDKLSKREMEIIKEKDWAMVPGQVVFDVKGEKCFGIYTDARQNTILDAAFNYLNKKPFKRPESELYTFCG